jgi:hypothetical protein
MFKPILPILLGLLCSFGVFAQQVELQSDHPETYTVVRGDTLWDIAERFLQNPWLWPEIWQANPQIENPHLIYPGDVIRLVYVDGQPRLRVDRGEKPIVRLSPRVRATPLSEAVQPIDLDDIRKYFEKRTVLDSGDFESLPYVVALEEERPVGTMGQRVYVRGLDAEVGDTIALVQPTLHFMEVPESFPWSESDLTADSREWEYPGGMSIWDHTSAWWNRSAMKGYNKNVRDLGYEVVQTAVAEVIATGDPTSLLIVSISREVKPGNLAVPVFTTDFEQEYMPRPPAQVPDDTRVLAITKSLFGAGHTEVVVINRGAADGITDGEVFSVHYEGKQIRDEVKYPKDDAHTFFSRDRRQAAKVTLPDEYAGHVMVFKTYENISYGLIMRSKRSIQVNNLLKAP